MANVEVIIEFQGAQNRGGPVVLKFTSPVVDMWPQASYEVTPRPQLREGRHVVIGIVRQLMEQFEGQIKWVELRGQHHGSPGIMIPEITNDQYNVVRRFMLDLVKALVERRTGEVCQVIVAREIGKTSTKPRAQRSKPYYPRSASNRHRFRRQPRQAG